MFRDHDHGAVCAPAPRPPQPPPAVLACGLAKRFGAVEAVRGIDLEVAAGEAFGFLGPNGAGKSTTLNILCTLAAPTAGTARVAGFDVVNQRDDVRRHIGLVFQESTLDGYLSAEQNLRFHAELYGVPRRLIEPRIRHLMQMVGLWERRESLARTFSGGMKRRLEIARGLIHAPRVLFLDEPTIGLDPQTRAAIWAYLRALRQREEITVFMTTHYLDEAEYCDRIAVIDAGRIVAQGTPAALKAVLGKDRISIVTGNNAAAVAALKSRFGLDAAVRDGMVTFAVAEGERFVPRLCAELGVAIEWVRVTGPTLDDVFMAHTGTTIRDAEASRREQILRGPLARAQR